MASDASYIWIVRWGEFQKYQKKRGAPWAPPWLMNHTRQLDDDRYLDLTAAERGLLHDLRLEFARTRLNLRSDTTRLSQRLGYKVYTKQLERLSEAGFIRICSGTVQERLQHAFWNSSGLEVEEDKETERETEEPNEQRTALPPEPQLPKNAANGTAGGHDIEHIDPRTALAKARATSQVDADDDIPF